MTRVVAHGPLGPRKRALATLPRTSYRESPTQIINQSQIGARKQRLLFFDSRDFCS